MLRAPRIIFCLLLLALSVTVVAQEVAQEDDRTRAFRLYKDAKYTEALPLFEKLAAANPQDPDVIQRLGMLVYTQSAYLRNPEERKNARKRGREILLQAQSLGVDDHVLNALVAGTPPDGGTDESFSPRKEVEEAMQEGEAAFAKGEFSKALEMYQRALLLDPKLYEAAVYIGDVYYKTADQVNAGEWFARAIKINPDRETAYRYWGDSLVKQGRLTEAGDKFIEAYLAAPYSRLARAGFLNWGEKAHITLAHPQVDVPANVTSKDKGTTISLDANILTKNDKSGAAAAWMAYGIIRASWQTEFARQYPNEQTYRHSLKEEAAALRGAIEALKNQKIDQKNVDPSLQLLQKLETEGLLESFVLLALPDAGIAQDFPDYRRANLEKLRHYVKVYVLTGGTGKQ